MDEVTFQHELHRLKLKVEDMASRHSPRVSPAHMSTQQPSQQALTEGFHARLRDIKQHLTNLDEKLCANSTAPTATQPSEQRSPPQEQSVFPPRNRETLPSPPLPWELFASLRSDAHSIDSRVTSLEQTISDLENRVDSLEPPQFTPASSVATAAEAAPGAPDVASVAHWLSASPYPFGVYICSIVKPDGGVCNARFEGYHLLQEHHKTHVPDTDKKQPFVCSYYDSHGGVPCLYRSWELDQLARHSKDHLAAGHGLHSSTPYPEELGLNDDKISLDYDAALQQRSLDDLKRVIAARHNNTKVAEALLRTKLDAAQVSVKILRKYNKNMEHGAASLDKHNAKLVSNIMKLHSRLSLDHGWNAPRLQEHVEEIPGEQRSVDNTLATHVSGSAQEPVFDDPLAAMQVLRELDAPDAAERRASMATEVPAPSITMEHEIQHLDPAVPRRGQVPVEGVAFRDMEIARMDELLRQANEDRQRSEDRAWAAESKVAQQDEDIRGLQEEIAQREEDLQHLNEYLRSRDEQRDRLLRHLREASERSQEKTAVICAADQKIDELQRILRDCQNSKDEEIDRMMQGRENEIRRLQEFCEQKEVIARRQEEVIARGVRLVGLRDEEIGQLSRKLKATEDDLEYEGRQRDRMAKLLGERDGQLAELEGRSEAAAAAASAVSEREHHSEVGSNRTTERVDDGAAHNSLHSAENADRASSDVPSAFSESKPEKAQAAPHASWPPRPNHGNRRLAEEARRASVWQYGPESSQPGFGRLSPMGHRSHHAGPSSQPPRLVRYSDNDAEIVHEAPRSSMMSGGGQQQPPPCRKRDGSPMSSHSTNRPREMEEVQREGSGSIAAPAHYSANQQHRRPGTADRRSLPMDRTFWPPLPAPVAATQRQQRMHPQSMADIRSTAAAAQTGRMQNGDDGRERLDRDDEDGARGGGARRSRQHRSMQELHKRQRRNAAHQAYVETEAESGGEMGGDARR